MRSYAGRTCRRPGAQRPRLRRRARSARGSDPAAAGARARSAHAIGAERVTRGDAGSQFGGGGHFQRTTRAGGR